MTDSKRLDGNLANTKVMTNQGAPCKKHFHVINVSYSPPYKVRAAIVFVPLISSHYKQDLVMVLSAVQPLGIPERELLTGPPPIFFWGLNNCNVLWALRLSPHGILFRILLSQEQPEKHWEMTTITFCLSFWSRCLSLITLVLYLFQVRVAAAVTGGRCSKEVS